jgi:uncharacterized protein YwqG
MPSFVYTLIAIAVVVLVMSKVEAYRHQRKMRAAPRITQAELDAVRQSFAAATLPMAKMIMTGAAPSSATQSKIGGEPFADSPDLEWPTCAEGGSPMLFLAQINFAELPELPDFPGSGILQLFAVANAKGHIENTESEETRVIRWFPTATGQLTLKVPQVFQAIRKHGTLSAKGMSAGLAVSFVRAEAKANPYNWPFDEVGPNIYGRLGETPEVEKGKMKLEAEGDAIRESYGTHWVGGHPSFVQGDVRYQPGLRDLDRVILHLGFDEDVCLGDAGELNLMIRRRDLLARDFQKAFCTWDCG